LTPDIFGWSGLNQMWFSFFIFHFVNSYTTITNLS
jgi:hypothetical protein